MPSDVQVRVHPIPAWVDPQQFLADVRWERHEGEVCAVVPREQAADIAARIRGVGLNGSALQIQTRPSLKRADVRAGRLRDARARRDTSPGFRRKGTRCDQEGRWSLTPEDLALEIGRPWAGAHVIDLTCGAGGNAIGFARAGCRVTAIDRNASRLSDARHNARQYGVEDRISFVHGDALNIGPTLTGDLFFVDPPWGTDWNRTRTTLHDMPLLDEFLKAPPDASTWMAKVPPSFDVADTPHAAAKAWYGIAPGDRHRIKFVTLQWDRVNPSATGDARRSARPLSDL